MSGARKPSYNGLETELSRLRQGHGLGLQTVEKINTASHLLLALGISREADESTVEFATRAVRTLAEFIETNSTFSDHERIALTIVFNLNPDEGWNGQKLGARRVELEQATRLGRRRCVILERTACRRLIDLLLRSRATR